MSDETIQHRELSLAEKAAITNTPGGVRFLCPQCGKYEIVRSRRERENAIRYTCPQCGFSGPN